MIPANLPRSAEIHVDARMFWATFSISVFAALLVGLLPALEASAVDLNRGLQGQGRGTAGSVARSHLRRLLVSGEVALSLVLLIAAGLLLKSFLRLRDLQPGFDSRNALAVRLALPSARYSTPAAITALHDRLRQRLASLPQVESAGAASILPLSGLIASADFQISGRAAVHGKDTPTASYRMVDWNYFPAMRMPILRGRNFTEQDRARSKPVAIISDVVARLYWPDRDPVGSHLLLEDDTAGPRDVEVVGVVGNVRLLDLESDPPPVVYVPLHQIPADNARWIAINWFWVIRTHGGFSGLDQFIRRELHAVDGDIAASSIQPVDEYLSGAFATRRFSLSLIAAFAGAALLLAACGLYALISHFVIQRTREIGVRVALGAQARDIFLQVVGEGLLLTSAGVAAGLAGAFLAARLISTMLFGVTGYDAITMAEVATLLLATGVAASYFPARRAIRIDPLVALREE
jgi:putative ABC transport system permease protein